MTKTYPIVLYPVREDGTTSYSALVPDFPGCISSGGTLQESLKNAREALDLHLQALIESGESIAEPSSLDQLRERSDPEAIYGVIEVPLSEIQEKALARKSTRINVTFPGDLLREIDEYCEQSGLARSRFFQLLAERFLKVTPESGELGRVESALREIRVASTKGSIDPSAWDKFRSTFESVWHPPYCDSAPQQGSLASSSPLGQSRMLFAVFLLNAFWALEDSLSERVRKEQSKTPALDPARQG